MITLAYLLSLAPFAFQESIWYHSSYVSCFPDLLYSFLIYLSFFSIVIIRRGRSAYANSSWVHATILRVAHIHRVLHDCYEGASLIRSYCKQLNYYLSVPLLFVLLSFCPFFLLSFSPCPDLDRGSWTVASYLSLRDLLLHCITQSTSLLSSLP